MTAEARKRPSLQWAALFVLVIAGSLLGGCDGLRAKPAATPPQFARLPERTGEQVAYELLDALYDSPVTVELPPGFTALPPQEGATNFFDLTNVQLPVPPSSTFRGGVAIVLKRGVIWFLVYITAADAEAAFLATDAAPPPPGYNTFTPTGFDLPARCRTAPATPNAPGSGGLTACLALAGNAIVAGTSLTGDDPPGVNERAIAMARVAIAQLRQVQDTLAHAAAAPPARRPVRVGILTDWYWGQLTLLQGFHERLAELGWVRGRDLAFEYRFADGQPERLPALAAELVRERVDVIVPLVTLPSARAARDATAGSGIPVVFMLQDGSDPVAEGLVPSLARPGASITGVALPDSTGLAAKRLDLLAEALPSVRHVGVLIDSTDGPLWRELEETARARGVTLLPQVIRAPADMPAAVAAAKAAGAQALLQATSGPGAGPVLNAVAAQHGLPWVSNLSHYGGLLVYIPSLHAVVTRGAEYVDLVLRGIPPTHLPVELVRDYDLIVNLGVAQRLGLEVAPSVMARATHLSEPTTVRPRRVR